MNVNNSQEMSEIEYYYYIVCHSRSGSHLLGTLLNSHSKIACVGEAGELLEELSNARGEKTGRIISHYEFLKLIENKKLNKVIHLIRDPRQLAISRDAHSSRLRKFTEENPPQSGDIHFTKPTDIYCSRDMKYILDETKLIRKQREEMRGILKSFDSIEISYEEMTNSKSIVELNHETTIKLLNFLEVEHETLSTTLVKARHIYTNR